MIMMAVLARPVVDLNFSGWQMAYQRSMEIDVSVITDTVTETVCKQAKNANSCADTFVRNTYGHVRAQRTTGPIFRYFVEFLASRQLRAYPYQIYDDSLWERFATRNNRTFSGRTRAEYRPKEPFCT